MLQHKTGNKELLIFWFFLFMGLLVLGIIYFTERAFSFDAAYQVFHIVQDRTFSIQGTRFGAIFIQFPALLLVFLGASLKWIGLSYSASSIVLPMILSLILYRIKAHRIFFVSLIFPLIFYSHSFYWAHSELFQACYWSLLALGVLLKANEFKPIWFYTAIVIATGVSLFLHPLAPAIIGFGLLYLWSIKQIKPNILLFYSLLGIIIVLIKYLLTPMMEYDRDIYLSITGVFHETWDWVSFKSSKQFRSEWIKNYLPYPFILIGIILFYLRERKIQRLLFILGSLASYLFLVHSLFRWALPSFQMENYYQIAAIMLAFPLAFELLPNIKNWNFKGYMIIILGVIFLRLLLIYSTGFEYKERVEQVLRTFEQYPSSHKLIVSTEGDLEKERVLAWSLPYESLLISNSSIKRASKVILDSEHNSHNELFSTQIERIPFDQLDSEYFPFDMEEEYTPCTLFKD